jgi:hypothetical protein
VWIGSPARTRAARPLFFALNAQHVKRSGLVDWLGATVMLLGVASWGALAVMLGA